MNRLLGWWWFSLPEKSLAISFLDTEGNNHALDAIACFLAQGKQSKSK